MGFTIRFRYNTMWTRQFSRYGRPLPRSPLPRGGNRRRKVTFFKMRRPPFRLLFEMRHHDGYGGVGLARDAERTL
jgi:hypothetical protein